MTTAANSGICNLPNELLMQILLPFSTGSLLPLALVSHRFHDIILRILHYRLMLAASLKDHKLILECFHPSCKYTEPPLHCEYLGTPGLTSREEGRGSIFEEVDKTGRLGKLGSLYSRFRPYRPESEDNARRPHPAGDVPGSRTSSVSSPTSTSANQQQDDGLVSQTISLESHELFSQLCAISNIVKVGPRKGIFLGYETVVDGVVRVWRDWLANKAKYQTSKAKITDGDRQNSDLNTTKGQDQILWVDIREDVGFRLRVKERRWRPNLPILLHKDEDVAVSYQIEYEGDES
ncbi:MAG: hypothetical protein M1827_004022 [Pycnora praestabilis]|nr:MAG: hypothetical protein M1827_004022 [Pycnora praestabilis]